MNKYLLMLLLSFVGVAQAGVNKCVVNGKTIYTQDSCPNASNRNLELKELSNSGSQYDASVNLKINDENNWYKTDTKKMLRLSKYLEPYDDINPSVYTSMYSGSFDTRESYFKKIISNAKSQDPNANISSEILDVKVSNYNAYYKKITSTALIDGKSYSAIIEYWVIPRGNNIVVLTFSASKNNWSESRGEALKIINSLEFK